MAAVLNIFCFVVFLWVFFLSFVCVYVFPLVFVSLCQGVLPGSVFLKTISALLDAVLSNINSSIVALEVGSLLSSFPVQPCHDSFPNFYSIAVSGLQRSFLFKCFFPSYSLLFILPSWWLSGNLCLALSSVVRLPLQDISAAEATALHTQLSVLRQQVPAVFVAKAVSSLDERPSVSLACPPI